jgi:hypothetical protein
MSGMTILVRTPDDPLAIASAARAQLQQLDPELPMAAVATMDQLLSDSLSRSRFTMLLLGIFAAGALLLASVGIYGLIAYSVTQRTQELGIRIALGAQRRDVLRLVLAQGTRLTILGVAIGVFAALIHFAFWCECHRSVHLCRCCLLAGNGCAAGLLHSCAARHARRSNRGSSLRVNTHLGLRRLAGSETNCMTRRLFASDCSTA